MARRGKITSPAVSSLLLTMLVAMIWLVHRATSPGEPDPRPLVPPRAIPPARPPADDLGPLEDGGLGLAREFTPPIRDPASLDEIREAIAIRGPLGLAVLRAEFGALRLGPQPMREQVIRAAELLGKIGLLHAYLGQDAEAAASFRQALALDQPRKLPAKDRSRLGALLGVVSLHESETASSTRPRAAREAVARFAEALRESPDDLRVRWLLNLARLRLGEPDSIPEEHRIPVETSPAGPDESRFVDVASAAGLHARGPSQGGGTCFDDFNGDGRPDLLLTSLDAERGVSLFVNRGDGTFLDLSAAAGLEDQIHSAGLTAADYDNDGDLDVVLLRGAGEMPLRLSLLRNRGDGSFDDVTLPAGLGEPIAAAAAAWGDYDDDGHVDLFVGGEYRSDAPDPSTGVPDRRNLCRLYHNRGDGTFRDAAIVAGVENRRCTRGAAWGDFDGDGRLDLFVANADGPSRLYRNQGHGTFLDVTAARGLGGFPSGAGCGFWDLDRDGRLDLFLTDDRARPAEFVAVALGRPLEEPHHPRVFRNLGTDGFRDVTRERGLDRPLPILGSSFADLDNDGDLDLYFSCGWPGLSSLVPGRLLRNEGAAGFVDATLASGTGTLRGGLSVAFADADGDGSVDLFIHGGGFVPGQRSNHALFRNPGHGGHWLRVKLVGTRANRSAIGATIRVVPDAGDSTPPILRVVGQGSGCGGNSLVQTVGIGSSARVRTLTIHWPGSQDSQEFHDLEGDREVLITEGSTSFRVVPPPSRLPADASIGD